MPWQYIKRRGLVRVKHIGPLADYTVGMNVTLGGDGKIRPMREGDTHLAGIVVSVTTDQQGQPLPPGEILVDWRSTHAAVVVPGPDKGPPIPPSPPHLH